MATDPSDRRWLEPPIEIGHGVAFGPRKPRFTRPNPESQVDDSESVTQVGRESRLQPVQIVSNWTSLRVNHDPGVRGGSGGYNGKPISDIP